MGLPVPAPHQRLAPRLRSSLARLLTTERPASRPALLPTDPTLRVPCVLVLVVLVVAVAAMLGAGPDEATAAALVTGVAGVVGLRWAWRAGVAVVTWALVTGFVVNDGAQLTFGARDLLRLGLLLLALLAVPAPRHRA